MKNNCLIVMLLFLIIMFFAPSITSHANSITGTVDTSKVNEALKDLPDDLAEVVNKFLNGEEVDNVVDDDYNKDIKTDDTGHITSGYAHSIQYNSIGYYTHHYAFSAVDGGCLYFVARTQGDMVLRTLFVSEGSASYQKATFFTSSDGISEESSDSGEIRNSIMFGTLTSYTVEDTFSTNIPVFDDGDEEGIQKYVESGDYSSATNAGEIDKNIADNTEADESIEKPVGLKAIGIYEDGFGASAAYSFDKDKPFQMTWTQTVDTTSYVYDVQAQCVIGEVSTSGSTGYTGNTGSSGWIDFGTTNYNGAKGITCSISSDDLNGKLLEPAFINYTKTYGKLNYKQYLIKQLKVRVRNRSGSKASNWVVVTIDNDSATTNATVEDTDGNEVEDDEYDGSSVRDDTSDGSGEITSIQSLLAFIRDGFGLLGNGGIIDLMSRCFLYLPASIWTMLKFYVAMVVFVAVIALIKKFVFG